MLIRSRTALQQERDDLFSAALNNAAASLSDREYEHATGYIYTANVLLLSVIEESSTFSVDLNKLSWYMGSKREEIIGIAGELSDVLTDLGRDRSHPDAQNRLRNIINLIEHDGQ